MGDVKLYDKEAIHEMSDFELDDQFRWVRRVGVRFDVMGVGGMYWAPSLATRYGCNVLVGFNPRDVELGALDSVLIFCAGMGRFICEAWILGKAYSRYDVRDVRREHRNFLLYGMSPLKDLPLGGWSFRPW